MTFSRIVTDPDVMRRTSQGICGMGMPVASVVDMVPDDIAVSGIIAKRWAEFRGYRRRAPSAVEAVRKRKSPLHPLGMRFLVDIYKMSPLLAGYVPTQV